MSDTEQILTDWYARGVATPAITSRANHSYNVTVVAETGNETWHLSFRSGEFSKGRRKADCEVVVDDAVLAQLQKGDLNLQAEYLKGSMSYAGKPEAALELSIMLELAMLKPRPQLVPG